MDLNRNRIPENVKSVHLIAVCGTAMGALACMLKDMGYEVTGSDAGIYPPMSDFLMEKGIALKEGFHRDNLAHAPDLVIVGNAVSRNNPEAEALEEMGLAFCSMPQALNRFAARGKRTVLVCGTHGKTTTSSIMAWVLHAAGLDPSFMIGGIVQNFNSNYRLGEGDFFVVEGDEYDTAFFDKGAKFFHFSPEISILTSVEFDHADIFRDLAHVRDTFHRYLSSKDDGSTLLAFSGDRNVIDLAEGRPYAVEAYGKGEEAFWRLSDVSVEPPWSCFTVHRGDEVHGAFRSRLLGEHNLFNALSVIAAAHRIGIPLGAVQGALETFEGARRRQEVRGVKNGITVMDDFAHHPTAVRETIKGVKPFYPEGRLIAVFEPRTNSSMRKVFQETYPLCFDDADLVCIRTPSRLDKVREDQRFSSEKLTADLAARGKAARHFDHTDDIIEFLVETARPGDLVLVMSNGGFDNIHARLLERL